MPLGMGVGLHRGDFLLDGNPNPTPPEKGHSPYPIFDPCLLWPNGWMDEDATWYGSRPRPRPRCVRRGPSSPLRKGHSSIPVFSAHVYCGHSRPSPLLLSSCYTAHGRESLYFTMCQVKTQLTLRLKELLI